MAKKKKKKVTKTEIQLAIHSTIVALNLQKLLHLYNDLAQQHDVIPSPTLQIAIESSINGVANAISRKPPLAAISHDVANRLISISEPTKTK